MCDIIDNGGASSDDGLSTIDFVNEDSGAV
jgi:hypothetical protein